jgi:hypothetical protein
MINKEDKHDKFKRVASKRVNELLDKLDILGNCANKSNYSYTEEDIQKIFRVIDSKVKEVKSKFKIKKDKDFTL